MVFREYGGNAAIVTFPPQVRQLETRRYRLKESTYKSYDDLPLFLNAELVAQVLGISQAGAYDLLHSEGFPVLKIGTRMVVPKEKFCQWVEEQTEAGS